MRISVNGEPRELDGPATLNDLIESLDLNPRYVAIEVNQELVSRNEHAKYQLNQGDELEIVTLAGGG